ncbi:hypothetical protein [Chromohalobacter sp. 48-RD10]|uniref:hypothetical protein n=1 Tax=Chromohalobacter sp. 48-RD10 TaxID=2994063 RepID=UPI0024699335|nr:hypothetical protein [Chromohalobacter sp. 48-RD10]
MPPPCRRCHSQHLINLETARKLGIAAGALAGSLKSVHESLYAVRVPTVPSPHLPLSRVASAVIAGASGGIAGAAAGNQMIRHLLPPPGEGSPWLCLGCGHAFRVRD